MTFCLILIARLFKKTSFIIIIQLNSFSFVILPSKQKQKAKSVLNVQRIKAKISKIH